jgi:hypothetical protein
MASLEMNGPYVFSSSEIDRVVTKTLPGNYGLGYKNDEGTFIVLYVGRSDSDVNQELKARLDSRYQHFKYSYATSPKAAFEKECRNYHDFDGSEKLDNEKHPARPARTGWTCPVCNIFD